MSFSIYLQISSILFIFLKPRNQVLFRKFNHLFVRTKVMMEKASAMIEAKMTARVRNENVYLKFIWTLKMFIWEISRKKKFSLEIILNSIFY